MAKFKPHKMYSKDRIVKMAKTMKEHLDLKEKGFNHDSRRESSPAKMTFEEIQTKYRKFKAKAGNKVRKFLGEPNPVIKPKKKVKISKKKMK
tara:strand:- start:218 stop:493 length:276 start_codon:yes stop_codon:yes gene_type:complete